MVTMVLLTVTSSMVNIARQIVLVITVMVGAMVGMVGGGRVLTLRSRTVLT